MPAAYEIGKPLSQWRHGVSQIVTLSLTEECNLRCSYCYMLGKNPDHPMSREVALRTVDFFLSLPAAPNSSVVWELTGGEPLLELDLLTVVADHFKSEAWRLEHPWRAAYMFLVASNGTLYHNERYQRFLWENRSHVVPAITIDGTPRKHDMHRVFARGGGGSHAIVERNFRTMLRQFGDAQTKVTFAHADLGYLRESIVYLWELGIREVAANVVFEDVWQPGDAELFESQLRELADAAIDRGFWRTHRTNLFWERAAEEERGSNDLNWCGTGKMVAVDGAGNMYPCVRFMPHSLSRHPARPIGSVFRGFDEDALRAYQCLRKSLQSPAECLACDAQQRCAWCTGFNYEAADSDTMFQRMTYICEMHRAQHRANAYLWEQLEKRCGVGGALASPWRAVACPL